LLVAGACSSSDPGTAGPGDAGPGTSADGAPDAGRAGLPAGWTFRLEARTNLAVNPSGAFNLPPDHFVQGPLLQLGASGQVAFTVPTTPDGVRRAYVGRDRIGHLVDLAPAGAFVGPVSLDDRGRL